LHRGTIQQTTEEVPRVEVEKQPAARYYSFTPKGRKQLAAKIAASEGVTKAIVSVIQPA
jgi:DNA-binding PadR family transcriptional regulator